MKVKVSFELDLDIDGSPEYTPEQWARQVVHEEIFAELIEHTGMKMLDVRCDPNLNSGSEYNKKLREALLKQYKSYLKAFKKARSTVNVEILS